MPGERATGGVFLWLLSLHKQRKLPARPQGEWKLCTLKSKIKMDSRFRGNDVKRKELDSGVRRNHEQKVKMAHPRQR